MPRSRSLQELIGKTNQAPRAGATQTGRPSFGDGPPSQSDTRGQGELLNVGKKALGSGFENAKSGEGALDTIKQFGKGFLNEGSGSLGGQLRGLADNVKGAADAVQGAFGASGASGAGASLPAGFNSLPAGATIPGTGAIPSGGSFLGGSAPAFTGAAGGAAPVAAPGIAAGTSLTAASAPAAAGLGAGAGAAGAAGAGAAASGAAAGAVGGAAAGTGGGTVALLAALACHAAAEYYPLGSSDWHATRRWFLEGWNTPLGHLWLIWYSKNSQWLAAHLRGSRVLKSTLRPFFNWALQRGRALP